MVAQGRGGAMKLRIAIWAMAGALAVATWSLYFTFFKSDIPWALVDFTIPIALVRHYAMSVYFVLLVNALTYAVAGLLVETLWRYFKQHPGHGLAN
jgi:hypothetical protein